MQQVDLLIYAGWIVPVVPRGTVLENHAIAVNNGKIVDILPRDAAQQNFDAAESVLLDQHVLLPGLVNTHAHSAMALLKSYADDVPLQEWLNDHIWPAEGAHVGHQFVYEGSLLAAGEMIRSGTTCVNDMYFFPDAAAEAFTQAGMRSTLGLTVIEFPTAYAKDPAEYISKGLAVFDQYKNHPLVNFAFAPHAPYTVSDESFTKIGALANELDIPVHVHVHETAFEVEQAEQESGKRPLERLNDLGLVNEKLLAVHMTQLTKDEIKLCKKQKVSVLHCPESNMKLASGTCPVNDLTKAKVNVTLGTDGAASNNDLDMLGEAKTAAMLAKISSGDPSAVSAIDALEMATINGAKALGLAAEIGSLESGKAADITAIDMGNIESQPSHNVISQLIYSAAGSRVTDVWVAGKRLLNHRRLTTLSEAELLSMAAKWREKIQAGKEEQA